MSQFSCITTHIVICMYLRSLIFEQYLPKYTKNKQYNYEIFLTLNHYVIQKVVLHTLLTKGFFWESQSFDFYLLSWKGPGFLIHTYVHIDVTSSGEHGILALILWNRAAFKWTRHCFNNTISLQGRRMW
jgi:hypothetical protein